MRDMIIGLVLGVVLTAGAGFLFWPDTLDIDGSWNVMGYER